MIEQLEKEEQRIIQFAKDRGLDLMKGYTREGNPPQNSELAYVMGQLYVIRRLKDGLR